MKFRNIQTKGLILSKKKLGESDDLITLYSPFFGKIQATAKGGRKIDSHFSGHLEMLNICKLELYKTPHHFTIIQSEVEKNFKNIRQNLESSLLALMALEIFQKSTSIGEEESGLFELLEETLDHFEKNGPSIMRIESFKLKLLKKIGALPEIKHCSRCQKKWQEKDKIQLNSDTHLLCLECCHQGDLKYQCNFRIIKFISFLLDHEDNNYKIHVEKNDLHQVKKFTGIFLLNYLNSEVQSEKYITTLKN